MSIISFKKTLINNAQYLKTLGFNLEPNQPGSGVYRYLKSLSIGVEIIIEFQMLTSFPPLGEFSLYLGRRRRKAYTGKLNEYAPYMSSLAGLLSTGFDIEVFSHSKLNWQYNMEVIESLVAELMVIEKYLTQYGIPWLEDPFSIPPE